MSILIKGMEMPKYGDTFKVYLDAADNVLLVDTSDSSRFYTLVEIKEPHGRLIDAVEDFPTADVVPVVHGMWVRDEYGVIHCSVCNAYLKDEEYENHTFKKCYYCGADMRETDCWEGNDED